LGNRETNISIADYAETAEEKIGLVKPV